MLDSIVSDSLTIAVPVSVPEVDLEGEPWLDDPTVEPFRRSSARFLAAAMASLRDLGVALDISGVSSGGGGGFTASTSSCC